MLSQKQVVQTTKTIQHVAESIAKIPVVKDPVNWLLGEEENQTTGSASQHLLLQEVDPVPLDETRPWVRYPRLQEEDSCARVEKTSCGSTAAPFEVDERLNAKIFLYEGDPLALDVDAMVAPSATGYTAGSSVVFGRVLGMGGLDLREDIKYLEKCPSGEARITKAYRMPCRWLLHTVGPKWKDKYQTAAENTLHACYRECLKLLVENRLRTVAIPCFFYKSNYPEDNHVQVALRSLRRWLEKWGQHVDAVVVASSSQADLDQYESWLPAFFPRTNAEASEAAARLPPGAWTSSGETENVERHITISSLAAAPCEDDSDLFSAFEQNNRSFTDATLDFDKASLERLDASAASATDIVGAEHVCLRYLRRARELLPEPVGAQWVYNGGIDRWGRHIVVLLGSRIPDEPKGNRALPRIVQELERVKSEEQKAVVLYINSGVSIGCGPSFECLKEIQSCISARYARIVDQIVVLHPGLFFKAAYALGRVVLPTQLWYDTVYADSLAELTAFFEIERLGLPGYIATYDSRSSYLY